VSVQASEPASAISAVDVALRDLKARLLGVLLCALPGRLREQEAERSER